MKDSLPDKLSAERRFQDLVDAVNDYAIYMLTPEGVVSSWNSGAERFKGYRAEEIIGQHFSCFYTSEDLVKGIPAKALQTTLAEGKLETEGWCVRKDGSRFWASMLINPVRDESGHLTGFVKITRDITERKAAQKALRESENRFRLLVQGITDYAIYTLSPTGEVTNWNAGAERLYGYTAAEIIGTHYSRFYTDKDQANGTPMTELTISTRDCRSESENWRVRKNGSRFWAHVVSEAIHDDQGNVVGVAKIVRDITERRNSAEMLERARAALLQSEKMQAIGQLTGGIAHDFNNLLSVIVNALDLVSREVQSPSGIKVLEMAMRAAGRGATLTQQLLAFARRQSLRPEKCDFNKRIKDIEAVLHRACRESISFNLIMEPRLKAVLIDISQFQASLLNLVVNACDAMPTGGSLSIITENVEIRERDKIGNLASGPHVKVTVTDTGSGMTTEVAKHAFEPFFTTKEVGKGTGMGLSQVYGFVTQSGGTVEMETMVDQGTKIKLFLPAVAGATDESERSSLDVNMLLKKVLVVEDEPDLLGVVVELLRSMGYDVLSAGNAIDAIAILKCTPDIEVVFTDVVMPYMNGIELARHARQLLPEVKVILASGYPLPALTAEHGDLGDFVLLNKPYRLPELLKELQT